MSVVERTLRKLQGGAAPQPRAYGRVVGSATQSDGTQAQAATVNTRIVAIDQRALKEAGILPPDHQSRRIASQYRQIKRPLLDNAFGRERPALSKGRLIMMSSAEPGEGKTFSSINLAFSMARERDVHVLLIDADVLKPQTSNLLGLKKEPGLIDALADPGKDIEGLVLRTDVPNLSVLPSGKSSEVTTELLASGRMQDVLQQLLHHDPRRIVLFDTSPLNPTTESRVLAGIVGQIVLVIKAHQTEQRKIEEAVSYLPEDGNISLILNQSVSEEEGSYYYYGYGTEAQPQGSR